MTSGEDWQAEKRCTRSPARSELNGFYFDLAAVLCSFPFSWPVIRPVCTH
jgi:hypothetical protein